MELPTKMLRCVKYFFAAFLRFFGGRPRQAIACRRFHPPLDVSLAEFLLEIYRIEAMSCEQFVEFRAVALGNAGGK